VRSRSNGVGGASRHSRRSGRGWYPFPTVRPAHTILIEELEPEGLENEGRAAESRLVSGGVLPDRRVDLDHSRMRLMKGIMWTSNGAEDPKLFSSEKRARGYHLWCDSISRWVINLRQLSRSVPTGRAEGLGFTRRSQLNGPAPGLCEAGGNMGRPRNLAPLRVRAMLRDVESLLTWSHGRTVPITASSPRLGY
jgi:hypothetical protein